MAQKPYEQGAELASVKYWNNFCKIWSKAQVLYDNNLYTKEQQSGLGLKDAGARL